MTNEIIEQYFDSLAHDWDDYQECPQEVKRTLLERAGVGAGARVLDVACGTGAVTEELHSLTGEKVVGIDLSGEMIAVAKRKFAGQSWAEFEKVDFLQFAPTKSEQSPQQKQKGEAFEAFDFVVIYNAYPHFMNVSALRDKAYSLLAKGGKLAIIHSIGRECLNAHHKQHADHVSRMIGSPLHEAKSFEPLFKVEIAEEDEKHYLLVLTKK